MMDGLLDGLKEWIGGSDGWIHGTYVLDILVDIVKHVFMF